MEKIENPGWIEFSSDGPRPADGQFCVVRFKNGECPRLQIAVYGKRMDRFILMDGQSVEPWSWVGLPPRGEEIEPYATEG